MSSEPKANHPLEGRFPSVRVSSIIINERDEILLAKHKKKDREYWVLPGGHLEFGETFAECAVRELVEETSLQGEFKRVVFLSESIAPDGSRHILNVFALVKAFDGEIKIASDEDILCEVAYVPLDELKNLTVYPDVKKEIIAAHKKAWPNQQIELLQTPWS